MDIVRQGGISVRCLGGKLMTIERRDFNRLGRALAGLSLPPELVGLALS